MNTREMDQLFTTWTAENSGYDEHRNYIGLSTIADCPREIYRRFFSPTPADVRSRLKTRASYEIEENLKNRFRKMGVYREGREISLYNGLVKGHTDGEIWGRLLDIKTVPLEEHLPADNNCPAKVFWQLQAYMLYGQWNSSIVLYFARDYGVHKFFYLRFSESFGERIENRLSRIIRAIETKSQPDCECGRCR